MPKGYPDPNNLKPLSAHAWKVLRWIRENGAAGVGSHEFNAGVADRLRREGLIEDMPSESRRRYRITKAGHAKLDGRPL